MAEKFSLTLTNHILNNQKAHQDATGELSTLLHAIEIATKYTSSQVRNAGLLHLYGEEGSTNVQGEQVKKLDLIANEAFITSLKRSKTVCLMVSEENEQPIFVPDSTGKYVVAFDPLDGSSNIDTHISIGTIFGIFKRLPEDVPLIESILQPGSQLVAAGYAIYGSATVIVLSTGDGVDGFTYDPSSGEFVLTHPKIRIKHSNPIYSVNEGYTRFWSEATRKYVESLKFPEPGKKGYSHRYVGSMVADVHRTLLYGGIFMYPADANSKSGKIRLLYEANPISFIIEQAGGKATNGTQRILDIKPASIHQRTPVFLGSKTEVEDLEHFFTKYSSAL